MRIGFFYMTVSLCLIIVQTIVRPAIPWLSGFYDLLTPFIVYCCLFRPMRESAPTVLIVGFIMDNLSGGPFGLYMTTFIWLFICIQWLVKFLRIRNTLLLAPVVVGSVVLENLITLGALVVLTPDGRMPHGAVWVVTQQIMWAVLTGPVLLGLMQYGQQQWEGWAAARIGKSGVDEE